MGSWLGLEHPSPRAVGSLGSRERSESWMIGEKGQWVLRVEMGSKKEGW